MSERKRFIMVDTSNMPEFSGAVAAMRSAASTFIIYRWWRKIGTGYIQEVR